MKTLPRILCVDDELLVLRGIARNLRRRFDVRVVTTGREALSVLAADPTIEVICCDYRMPGMDGAEVLEKAKELAPGVSRVLLSGQADLEAVAQIVNLGGIHRFLTKPCRYPVLVEALEEVVEIHRLRRTELRLLDDMSVHFVRSLTRALELARPVAFAHCQRVAGLVTRLELARGQPQDWRVSAAAALVGLGFLSVPLSVVDLWLTGMVTAEEQAAIDRVPEVSASIVGGVPHLGEIGPMLVASAGAGPHDPWASRAIRLAREYVLLADRDFAVGDALAMLEPSWLRIDPELFGLLDQILRSRSKVEVLEVAADGLRSGMVLVSDLVTDDEAILLARGVEVTETVLERISNYQRLFHIQEPLRVLRG